MTPKEISEIKLRIMYNRLLGEFKGVLTGISYWDIPQELKERINEQLKRVEKMEEDYDKMEF